MNSVNRLGGREWDFRGSVSGLTLGKQRDTTSPTEGAGGQQLFPFLLPQSTDGRGAFFTIPVAQGPRGGA